MLEYSLNGVLPEWIDLFHMEELTTIMGFLESMPSDQISPDIPLIFEPFRYFSPQDLQVIILGQDPYPDRNNAQGLCFSVPIGVAHPPSLINIFKCLNHCGLRPNQESFGDLRPWASQGVLLINTALTTHVDKPNAHSRLWKKFMEYFMINLFKHLHQLRKPIDLLLWGKHAITYSYYAQSTEKEDVIHTIRRWSHPSPIADNSRPNEKKFKMCDHFKSITRICWDNTAGCTSFCDGACIGNGTPKARASFSSIIFRGMCDSYPLTIAGELRPNKYELNGNGLEYDSSEPMRPSNNRGELAGIMYSLLAMIKMYALGESIIYSDSNISVMTINEYLPSRFANGTHSTLANIDLLIVIMELLGQLKRRGTRVNIVWTRGHMMSRIDPEDASITPMNRMLYSGNNLSDVYATRILLDGTSSYDVNVFHGINVFH